MNDLVDIDDLDPALEARLRASLRARGDLASGVVAPEPGSFRPAMVGVAADARQLGARPRFHRRRSTWLVAAAIALVVAGVAVLVRSPSNQDVHISPATTAPVLPDDVPFLVDHWPAGFGPIERAGFDDPNPPGETTLERRVFGRDGHADVLADVEMVPLGRPDPTYAHDLTDVVLDGVTGLQWTADGRTVLTLAVRPGMTITLSSRVAGGETLRGLVHAFDWSDGSFDDGGLPVGWAEIPDPMWWSRIGFGGGNPRTRVGSVRAEVPSVGNRPQVMLAASWITVDDPDDVLAFLQDLWGGERVQAGVRSALMIPASAPPEMNALVAVFVLDEHHVGWVGGANVTRDDLLAASGSMRLAGQAEWDTLVASLHVDETPPDVLMDRGVQLQGASSVVLARGERDGARWAFATYDMSAVHPAGLPRPGPPSNGYQLGIRQRDGATTWSGGGSGSGPSIGGSGTRQGRFVTFIATIPAGIVAPGLRYEDRDLEVTTVPLGDGTVQAVIAVEPAIDIANIGGAVVTGTNPDGSIFQGAAPDAAAGMSFADAIGPG